MQQHNHVSRKSLATHMPPLPILYTFRRCPYAIRARLAIQVAGIAVEKREVVLKAKPAHLLTISPKGTVPVLQLPDGRVIEQSLDIMHWALAQNDPQGWLAHGDPLQAQQLLDTNDGPFKRLLDAYKYPERHPQRTSTQHRDEAVQMVLAPLDARLHQHPQLMGEQVHLVDMAVLPFVRQFAQVDADWFAGAPLPALMRWLHAHLSSPLFESVMQKPAGDTA
jgi:glutathione S-transferase